ncbi:hypothetical protein B9Z55_007401 [Caenorhabditis nigoni]|uniref:Uncharacterized protein n=1 Tax=Caenorhabditis nigoni TaxID=1611254 RepID=A0A2G5V9L3_9PELO|nr:hypothetical protein B9Z55_007401 [Caenorhabditis nigoni]
MARDDASGHLSRIPEAVYPNYLRYRRAVDYCSNRPIYEDQKIDLSKPRLFDTSSVEYPQKVKPASDRTGFCLFMAYRQKYTSKYHLLNEWRNAEDGSELRKEWKRKADELRMEQKEQIERGMITTKKRMGRAE